MKIRNNLIMVCALISVLFMFGGCAQTAHLRSDLTLDANNLRLPEIPLTVKTKYVGDFKTKTLTKKPNGFVGSGITTNFEIGQALSKALNSSCNYIFNKSQPDIDGTIEFELTDVDINYTHPSALMMFAYILRTDMTCKLRIKWAFKSERDEVIDIQEIIVEEKGTFDVSSMVGFRNLTNYPNAPINVAIKNVCNEFIRQINASPKIYAYAERQKLPTVIAAKEKEFLRQKISATDYADTEKIGRKYAVVIGISNYRNPKIGDLKYAAKDAEAVYKFLIDPYGGDFPAENTKLLLDSDATQIEIRSTLGTFLARKALKNDFVFIFFAGHGSLETDYEKKEPDGYAKYLLAWDTNPSDLYASAVPMNEISTIFNRIESNRLIFMADTCYSGASGGRTFAMSDKFRSVRVSGRFLDRIAQGQGRIILTASDINEPAMESDELGHGLFTYYFLDGLNGGADMNEDGYITLYESYSYLYDKVARKSKELGGNQHPIWKGNVKGHLILKKVD